LYTLLSHTILVYREPRTQISLSTASCTSSVRADSQSIKTFVESPCDYDIYLGYLHHMKQCFSYLVFAFVFACRVVSLCRVPVSCPCVVSLCRVPVSCPCVVSLCRVPVSCPCVVSLCRVPVSCESPLYIQSFSYALLLFFSHNHHATSSSRAIMVLLLCHYPRMQISNRIVESTSLPYLSRLGNFQKDLWKI
jgi:hypothetical protein